MKKKLYSVPVVGVYAVSTQLPLAESLPVYKDIDEEIDDPDEVLTRRVDIWADDDDSQNEDNE